MLTSASPSQPTCFLPPASIHQSGISPPDARYAVMCSVRSSEMYSPYAGSCASHQPAAFCFLRISYYLFSSSLFSYLLQSYLILLNLSRRKFEFGGREIRYHFLFFVPPSESIRRPHHEAPLVDDLIFRLDALSKMKGSLPASEGHTLKAFQ